MSIIKLQYDTFKPTGTVLIVFKGQNDLKEATHAPHFEYSGHCMDNCSYQ